MENNSSNPDFWTRHYKDEHTPWDIGAPSTPLTTYIDQLTDPTIRILIPGAGFGHEAEYLWKKGFTNVVIAEFSEIPLNTFRQRCPEFPEEQILKTDFFDIEDSFDLIIEQTFFCALHPSLRAEYMLQMYELLVPRGRLVGVLFQFPLTENGPPYGGSKEEYHDLFKDHFEIRILEDCYNSIPPRSGNELFILFQKKKTDSSVKG